MSKLFFPSPLGPQGPSPAYARPIEDIDPTARRAPANFDFTPVRRAARILRQPKTPFIPKKVKEKDLSGFGMEELSEMLERNTRLLESPSITAGLPDGDKLIRHHQSRIINRLQELKDVHQIKVGLEGTHLEEEDSHMESPKEPTELKSPRTKAKILHSIKNTSHSLTSAISFQESFQLQKKALERERIALAKKQLQLNAENHGAGEKLKKALGAQPDIASFMFHTESDGEEEEKEETFEEIQQVEEELELNPYREAFISGYNEAEAEVS